MSDADTKAVPDETWGPQDPRWEAYYAARIPYEGPIPTKHDTKPLPESFGRNLDTLEKARLWLTNPHNWHSSKLFILKWNGLLPTVSEEHGKRLIREHWDSGLPWCVVYGQRNRRTRGERGLPLEDAEPSSGPSEE